MAVPSLPVPEPKSEEESIQTFIALLSPWAEDEDLLASVEAQLDEDGVSEAVILRITGELRAYGLILAEDKGESSERDN